MLSTDAMPAWFTHSVAVFVPQVKVTRPLRWLLPLLGAALTVIAMPLPALPELDDRLIQESDLEAVHAPVAVTCTVPLDEPAGRLSDVGLTEICCDAAPACTMVADAVLLLPLVVAKTIGMVTGSVDWFAAKVTTTVALPLPLLGEMVTPAADVVACHEVEHSRANSWRVSAAIMLMVPKGVTRM